jgi:hypothetical protein
MSRLNGDFIPELKLTHEQFLKQDYSFGGLSKALKDYFGKDDLELKKMCRNEKFNIWVAYDYLKKYTGILGTWFTEEEYQKRIKNIQDVLNV